MMKIRPPLLMFIGAIVATSLVGEPGVAGAGITYSGRLLKPDGLPVTASSVQFHVQIRTPGNENCLLYQETHTLDLSSSNGMFALTINDGTATVVNTEPFTLDRAFQNRGTFAFAGGKCAAGSSYAPNPTDGRRIAVEFDDGSGGGFEQLPAQAINFVPMSMESMTVGGYGSGSMLRVNDGTGEPAAVAALTQVQYNSFLDLLAGTSSSYLTPLSSLDGSKISGNISVDAAGFTGPLVGDVTGTQGSTSVVKLRGRDVDAAPPSNGQVLKWNSTANRWEAANETGGGGSIASVTGTGAIQINGTSTDPIVDVQDSSTSVKGVVQLATSGQNAANVVVQGNDSRLSDARAPTAHTHVVDEITSASGKYFSYLPNNVACANGETLKWDSTNSRWICGTELNSELNGIAGLSSNGFVKRTGAGVYSASTSINESDLNHASSMTVNAGVLVTDGTQVFKQTCSGNQVLVWTVANGWSCSNAVLSESDPKVGANTTDSLSKWNGSALVASAVSEVGGSVGIGTSTPINRLSVYYSSPNGTVTKDGFSVTRLTTTSANATSFDKGATIALTNYTVPAGVTDSGYKIGVEADGFAFSTNFAGTLNENTGLWARAGINTASSGAVLNNAYGVKVDHGNNQAGTTVGNSYGVYIGSWTGGTTTNLYDVYAASPGAKNYFAGNVGVGTTNPTSKLEVAGTITATQYSGLAATSNFQRIVASLTSAPNGGSANATCPAGYTLLSWGLITDLRTQSGTSSWDNGGTLTCTGSGNTVTVTLSNYASGSVFTTVECQGLCARN